MNQKIISQKTIIITGTHLTPALELINQLKNDKSIVWSIHYIGRLYNSISNKSESIESRIIPELNIKFYPINCGKYDRRFFLNTVKGLPLVFKSIINAISLIDKIKPDLIVSFGGYVSVPIIIASRIKKIPSITHEQTLTNSLTTKINSFFVNKIALSFDNPNQINALPQSKTVVTGNLLRSDIFKDSSNIFDLTRYRKPIIYVTAGNQGSSFLNSEILKLIPQIPDFTIIHQTGKTEYEYYKVKEKLHPNYHVFDYIRTQDIGWVMRNSDIIISRSGANTSQEIVALNKKSILIPLPYTQQNEQKLNAQWVKKELPDQTIIIYQPKFTLEKLLSSIHTLIKITPVNPKKDYINNLKLLHLIHEIA